MQSTSHQLRNLNEDALSPSAKQFLKNLRHFEQLYALYLRSPNKQTVLITHKMQLETYGLLAKNKIIILACVSHNRTNKSVADILAE